SSSSSTASSCTSSSSSRSAAPSPARAFGGTSCRARARWKSPSLPPEHAPHAVPASDGSRSADLVGIEAVRDRLVVVDGALRHQIRQRRFDRLHAVLLAGGDDVAELASLALLDEVAHRVGGNEHLERRGPPSTGLRHELLVDDAG